MDVKAVLEELGYRLVDDRSFWRTKPLYRNSKNPTSLRIHKESGGFTDFSAGESGNLLKLIALTKGFPVEKSKEWLEAIGQKFEQAEPKKPKVKMAKQFDISCLSRLLPSYSFYENKKISRKTLREFKCGLATYGKMLDRIVFPIINNKNQTKIDGFAGRDVTDKRANKWKLTAGKTSWCYPLFLSEKHIFEKDQVIIVESVGDMLALWECGVKNVLVAMGVVVGKGILAELVRLNVSDVVVAFNNEPDNNSIGNKAAEKAVIKIKKILGNGVRAFLPTKSDFGFMIEEDRESINEWIIKLNA